MSSSKNDSEIKYKNPLYDPVKAAKSQKEKTNQSSGNRSRSNSITDEVVVKNPLFEMIQNEKKFFEETQESRQRSYTLNRQTSKKLEQMVKQTDAKVWIRKILPDVTLSEDFAVKDYQIYFQKFTLRYT